LKKQVTSVEEVKRKLEQYCVYQDRCHKEIEQKLNGYNLIPQAKEAILLHLLEHNFVNEERFDEIIQQTALDDDDRLDAPLRIVLAGAGQEAALYYSCNRFANIQQAFYLLVDTMYEDLHSARNRINHFNEKGLSATAVWSPCLGGQTDAFLLYVDEMIPDSLEASTLRDSLQLQLDTLERQLQLIHFEPK